MIFFLIQQAKALTAQTGETDKIRFLVGTQSLRVENQVNQQEQHWRIQGRGSRG